MGRRITLALSAVAVAGAVTLLGIDAASAAEAGRMGRLIITPHGRL